MPTPLIIMAVVAFVLLFVGFVIVFFAGKIRLEKIKKQIRWEIRDIGKNGDIVNSFGKRLDEIYQRLKESKISPAEFRLNEPEYLKDLRTHFYLANIENYVAQIRRRYCTDGPWDEECYRIYCALKNLVTEVGWDAITVFKFDAKELNDFCKKIIAGMANDDMVKIAHMLGENELAFSDVPEIGFTVNEDVLAEAVKKRIRKNHPIW